MWKRIIERLRCPVSGEQLQLVTFEANQLDLQPIHRRAAETAGVAADESFSYFITEGLLLAPASRLMYPVSRGLPLLLPYQTSLHREFATRTATKLAKFTGYEFPHERPAPGEADVSRSFSQEWKEYKYDGVLWEVTYEDNRNRLLVEIGADANNWRGKSFLEVGCGIGVTTAQAQHLSATDAVGVDLSLAVLKAVERFRGNPFLHYVQASAFALPFARETFDIVYSRGVLHHTYSTRAAFLSMAASCRPGGTLYLWVYGPRSISANPARLAAFGLEAVLRPLLSRAPSPVATVVLIPVAGAYIASSFFRRLWESSLQPYSFSRALHAARDRFTPRFAYRHSESDVKGWFHEADCEVVETVDWHLMPAADQGDYRRNTGVRAKRRYPQR